MRAQLLLGFEQRHVAPADGKSTRDREADHAATNNHRVELEGWHGKVCFQRFARADDRRQDRTTRTLSPSCDRTGVKPVARRASVVRAFELRA